MLMWQSDTAINRLSSKYSRSEQSRRVLWMLGIWLIRLSPRPCFAWRRLVLRLFGARVGCQVRLYASTKLEMPWNVSLGDWCALGEDVYIYSLGPVSIGERATISYRAHVCAGTHDLHGPATPLLKPPVNIGCDVWIGTEAFIGPGVTLGDASVVGARAVVIKDVSAMQIVAGNPARSIGMRQSKNMAPVPHDAMESRS